MKKLKILGIVLIVIFAAFAIFYFGIYKNRVLNKHMYRHANPKTYFTELDKVNPSRILYDALSGFYSWDVLPLSDNFKKKFKTRQDLIPEFDLITSISSGYKHRDDEEMILIHAEQLQSIFTDRIYTYYFSFRLNDKRQLDDVKLIREETYFTGTDTVASSRTFD